MIFASATATYAHGCAAAHDPGGQCEHGVVCLDCLSTSCAGSYRDWWGDHAVTCGLNTGTDGCDCEAPPCVVDLSEAKAAALDALVAAALEFATISPRAVEICDADDLRSAAIGYAKAVRKVP